ncbi:MAG: XisI protein [Anaerolineae bacterium]|nr:XisI protein [Anaerolineae bacterium]
MDQLIDLTQIVRQEINRYHHVEAWKSQSFLLTDAAQQVFAVIDLPDADHPLVQRAGIVVMARIVSGKVIIDEDATDRPLYRYLMEAGIPREQIILAYAGESHSAEPAS